MAKAKKGKLTIEDALVPVEEQPYEIPENWEWIFIENCCDEFFTGKSPKYSKEPTEYPIIGQQANQRYGIDLQYVKYGTQEFAEKQEDKYYLQYNDVLLNTLGTGSIGRSGIVKFNKRILTDGHPFVFRTHKYYSADLLYYYLQLNELEIINTANGSTNQRFLSQKTFGKYPIPLPPLAEQKRIVGQIENLFSKLDEAKDKLNAVIDSCTERRAAILKEVFSGRLSESWRKDNQKEYVWEELSFEDYIDIMQNGLSKRSGTEGKMFGVLRLANLEEDGFNTDDLREIKLTDKEQDTYKLNVGDIIMIRVNGSKDNVGRQIMVKEEHDWAFCDHIIRMTLTDNVEPEFMIMFSKTDEYRYYIDEHMVSSAGQNTISRKGLSDLKIAIPSIEEQRYLISVVNEINKKDSLVKEYAENTLEQIELMKKSILAKAFRGELGTNITDEESSIELLKSIIEA